jgi:Na+/proline symporter
VALSSLLVFPGVADIARAFPYVDAKLIGHDMAYPAMLKFLPAGFMGVMLAGLLAAYVSTLSTHLNWGTSYLVHDFYRRFLRPGASETHYVVASRVVTGLLMLLAALLTLVLETARQSFELMMSVGAGTGLIYLLRWFWWRVNAWSEIAAMVSSFLVAVGFFVAGKMGYGVSAHISLVCTVAVTTVVWIAVAYLTPPTDRKTLVAFCRLARPAGPGWNAVRGEAGVSASPDSLAQALLGWTCGCALVYAGLFGTGSFLYGKMLQGTLWLVVFAASGLGLLRLLRFGPRAAARASS